MFSCGNTQGEADRIGRDTAGASTGGASPSWTISPTSIRSLRENFLSKSAVTASVDEGPT